jgi:hypothetical protein
VDEFMSKFLMAQEIWQIYPDVWESIRMIPETMSFFADWQEVD